MGWFKIKVRTNLGPQNYVYLSAPGTEVEIELIDLDNQEIINCDLPSAAIVNYIDIPSDTPKTIQDIRTPIRKAKHVVGLKYFKKASRDVPGKTPGKVHSDLQISDTE